MSQIENTLLKFSSNGLVAELDNMVKLAEKCNIQVPMEVVK
jgi:mediator of RNA polymerase II transcription subunit 10